MHKLFERCILQLLDTEPLEGSHQHGFRPYHNTTTAMLEIQSIISERMNVGEMVLVYSTDLSVAFDLLRPGVLLKSMVGRVPYSLCRIILDFLSDRSFCVKVGSSLSSERKMIAGCAQGSTLGPKLFSVYCGGLKDVIQGILVAYADDANVLLSGSNIETLRSKASEVMGTHVDWLQSIGMVVNVSKTEATIFSRVDLPLVDYCEWNDRLHKILNEGPGCRICFDQVCLQCAFFQIRNYR